MMTLPLLANCGAYAPTRVDETVVKQFAARGYMTDERFSISATAANWRTGDLAFDIAWTTPVSGNALPVLIYLPGLGESRSAGESWRTAWAQAGYAVLSVQLLQDDQKAWSSAAARRGDFAALAQERYAKDAVSARLRALASLMSELQKRQREEPLLHRLDLSQIAIAGFDVGAYTSMLVAGEQPKGDAIAIHWPISIAAIIALSPYADFSGSALSTRYQAITAPVLTISGDADTDAAHVVSSPSLRKAPFEYMPSKNAYLLWLVNATHPLFSGGRETPDESSVEQASGMQGAHSGSSRGDRRGKRDASSGIPGEGNGRRDFGGIRLGETASPTDRAISVSLIQGISTAFLDAYLKKDTIAQEWLQKNARRWIAERGEFRRK